MRPNAITAVYRSQNCIERKHATVRTGESRQAWRGNVQEPRERPVTHRTLAMASRASDIVLLFPNDIGEGRATAHDKSRNNKDCSRSPVFHKWPPKLTEPFDKQMLPKKSNTALI